MLCIAAIWGKDGIGHKGVVVNKALLNEILEMEQRVWRALCEGDGAADEALLMPGFVGVYPDGVSGREAHAGQLDAGASVATYALNEARVLPVGAEHVMLIYNVRFRRIGRDADEAMYVSSLWQRVEDGWRNLFSQDTPHGEGVP